MTLDWKAIKMDIKQRFLNYESAKGLFFVGIGLAIAYTAVYHIEYAIQVGMVGFGLGFFVVEGLRKILVNRIKQQIKQDQLKQEALKTSGAKTEAPKVASPGTDV